MRIEKSCAAPSVEEMQTRIARLQTSLDEHGLTGYVSFAPANVLWLTNFANFVHERPFALFVPREGLPKFLVPFLELDQCDLQSGRRR